MAKKLLPFMNRTTGEIKTLTRAQGSKLGKEWSRPQMATNQDGQKVFRFELDSEVKGKDGKTHTGTAVVDLVPVEASEVTDG